MIQDAWNAVIQFSALFITPDWGSLIGLLPLILALVVVLYLAWTARRFGLAGPAMRGIGALSPVAPARIHAPVAAVPAAAAAVTAEHEPVADGPTR